jgi:tRNA threonylcarbamoyladenosine biosynthesis protein TsaE
MTIQLELPTPEATIDLGRRLGTLLFPGAVLALVGPLGAGKTLFTRAVAEGLGLADSSLVTSPTFVLIQEYQARLPIYHFDTYRLDNPAAFPTLGADEYLEGDGVCIIEWADRVAEDLPPDLLRLELEPTGETSRRLTLSATGPRHQVLLDALEHPLG